jgi:conjugal transfer pilus assembly protein TraA
MKQTLAFPQPAVLLVMLLLPGMVLAATTGAEFQTAYQFFYDAATGYLGRGIAIVGGLIGLGVGAARGSALPAILGVILAVFGALGPTIIDAVFGSAVV